MTKTDDIGVWESLGVIVPEPYKWTKTLNPATDGNSTIRINCKCADWEKFKGYLLIRPSYNVSSGSQYGQAERFYPQENTPGILNIPIPEDFVERNVTFRYFEVMLFFTVRGRKRLLPQPLLNVEIEELLG